MIIIALVGAEFISSCSPCDGPGVSLLVGATFVLYCSTVFSGSSLPVGLFRKVSSEILLYVYSLTSLV